MGTSLPPCGRGGENIQHLWGEVVGWKQSFSQGTSQLYLERELSDGDMSSCWGDSSHGEGGGRQLKAGVADAQKWRCLFRNTQQSIPSHLQQCVLNDSFPPREQRQSALSVHRISTGGRFYNNSNIMVYIHWLTSLPLEWWEIYWRNTAGINTLTSISFTAVTFVLKNNPIRSLALWKVQFDDYVMPLHVT